MSETSQTRGFTTSTDVGTLIVIAGLTAVLFAGGLALSEGAGELGVDIDWKPFFVVYAVILFIPWGTPTIAAAVGGMLAEALGDIFEGAAPDDPFGWVGYVVGFALFGYLVKDDTSDYTRMAVAAVAGGFVQIAIEGLWVFAIGLEEASTLAFFGITVTDPFPFYVITV
ncbi:MAG: hypothetical protein SV377_00920, partial [Halobacteria archaeon]|nr:hypothetical protein [Halobacteria archaeon]